MTSVRWIPSLSLNLITAGLSLLIPVAAGAAVIQVPADFATIAAAVSAAAPYDTVDVAAGTYAEIITINQPLTLLGPNAGISPNTGTRVAEAVISPASGNGITLTGTGGILDDVTISGFQLDNIPGQSIRSANFDYTGIELSYNLFTSIGTYAIYSINGTPAIKNGATHNGTRQNWLIHENRFDGYTAATVYVCAMVNCWNENTTVTDNTFVDVSGLGAGRAITLDGTSDALISGNTFLNQNKWGVYLLDGAQNVDILNNTFTGGERGILLGASTDATDNPYIMDDVSIGGNTFTDNTNIAIDILRATAISGAIGNIDIRGNTFSQDAGALAASIALIDLKLDSSIVAGPVTIAENDFTFSGTFGAAVAAYGVRVRGGGVDTVNIDNNVMEGGGIGGNLSCGVVLRTIYDAYGVLPPTTVVKIRENAIHGFTNAITTRSAIYGDLPAGADVDVTGNDLSGNGGAIANYDPPSELIHGAGNWWGDSSAAAVIATAGGQVVYNCWLTSGTDTDLGSPGFQGDFSELCVDSASPQEAGKTPIQLAANLSSGGDIHILPGVYEEQVQVAGSMRLLGNDAATTRIVAPPALTSSFVTGIDNNYPVVYAHDAANVILENLTIDGAGRGNANDRFIGAAFRNAGGQIVNCTIQDIRNEPIDGAPHGVGIYALADDGTPRTLSVENCTIEGFQKGGMVLSGPDLTVGVDQNTITGAGTVGFIAQNGIELSGGATGSITGNTLSGFAYEPGTGVSTGIFVNGASSPVTVSGNQVQETQIGIYYVDSEGDISENTLVNTAGGMGTTPYWWCIVADPGAGAKRQPPVQPFDVMRNPRGGAAMTADAAALTTTVYRNEVDGGGNGTGIEADALGTETLNFSATENIVTNCALGFDLYRESGATLNAEVMHNSIAGNASGLKNQSGVFQEAGVNWWGDATGPQVTTNPYGTANSVSVDVDYSPWLSQPDAVLVTMGFQAASPMHWHANATSALPVSRVVGFAAAGDSISLKPGSYVDNTVINKTLAILGQDADSVILYPAYSDVGPPAPPSYQGSQIIVVRAHDVVLDNLTLDGDNPDVTPVGVVDARNGIITDLNSMGNWQGLTVTRCVVRNIFWRAIFAVANLNSAGHVIRDNVVQHVTGGPESAGIIFAGASGEIVGNTVEDASMGIAFWPGTSGSISAGRADSNTVIGGINGIVAHYTADSVMIRQNTVSDCVNGAGLQIVGPTAPSVIAGNTVSNCDTSLALHGGFSGRLQLVTDNRMTGNGQFGSVGIYASTQVNESENASVFAQLSRNVITQHSFGIMLNEDPSGPARTMNVTIGGAPSETDSLFGNALFGLFLASCDDDIDARYNYWGTSGCDSPEPRIWHQIDDAALATVSFDPTVCTEGCPVTLTGDANVTGSITSADIIHVVNFVFKGGPAPEPIAAAGDVNCDTSITAADIIYLVNFVFKGGTGPCDVCTIL